MSEYPKAKSKGEKRYGTPPHIETVKSEGDTDRAVAPKKAAAAAEKTADREATPHAGDKKMVGKEGTMGGNDDMVHVSELHATERKEMHTRHEKERRDMHTRHEEEQKAMDKKHMERYDRTDIGKGGTELGRE